MNLIIVCKIYPNRWLGCLYKTKKACALIRQFLAKATAPLYFNPGSGHNTTVAILNSLNFLNCKNTKLPPSLSFSLEKLRSTLLTPSFGNHLFQYHLVLKHPHTNMILSSFCIPKVVKSATKKLKIGS